MPGSHLTTGGIRYVRPEENLAIGRAAAQRVLEGKLRVFRAMYRADVGEVTFDAGFRGDPTRSFRGGFGLSHIAAKRTVTDGIDGVAWVLKQLPTVLAYGSLHRLYGPANGRRADIVLGGDQVSLALTRHGRRESWVLSGFTRWQVGRPRWYRWP